MLQVPVLRYREDVLRGPAIGPVSTLSASPLACSEGGLIIVLAGGEARGERPRGGRVGVDADGVRRRRTFSL